MADDSRKEKLDRELMELLNELRVALPGVQMLFAFLLTVPFTQRFTQVTEFQRTAYFVTLLCAAAASAFLIAPSAYHRIVFRQSDKHKMIVVSNGFAMAGLGFLALALVGAVMLITDFLFGSAMTVVVTAVTAALFATLWGLFPVYRRTRSHD